LLGKGLKKGLDSSRTLVQIPPMGFILNTLISALIIAGTVALSKRSSLLAAMLISIPISSVLAFAILYVKEGDVQKISQLSYGIFWMVFPSYIVFLGLPALLKQGVNFWLALGTVCVTMGLFYFGYSHLLKRFGIF